MEDSQELQMSTHSPVYERNCGMMCAYASGNNFEGVYAEYFEKMKAWRGTHGMEEVEPTIYYRWMHAVIKDVFKDEGGRRNTSRSGGRLFVKTHFRSFYRTVIRHGGMINVRRKWNPPNRL